MSIQDPSLAGVDYGAQRDQGLITSVTFLGSRPPDFAGSRPVEDYFPKIVQVDQIERDYRDMSNQQRKNYSQLLRDAGFSVPITGKYNINVRNALVQAYDEFDLEVRDLSSKDPTFFENNDYDLTKYLRDRPIRGEGTGGPQTIRYRQDPTDEALERGINEVYKELLGRGASKDESRRYAKKIRQQLNKVENMAQSTIVDVGGGVQQRTDRPGFDTNAFLYEQLGGNEEVKIRQIFSFYDTFKQALGVS